MSSFVHLHVHSQYSILDGAASIVSLVNKAKQQNMKALALTDHGNMIGIKEFHEVCLKNDIKPILGCETYVARRSLELKKDKEIDRSGYHLILLAKNSIGYYNLVKMITIANLNGFYFTPRIDKNLLSQYSEGLICSSACLGGEVASLIANNNIEEAEEVIKWYKNLFKDDYYLEVMHHPCTDNELKNKISDIQSKVNKVILTLAEKHQVQVIATNDVHFINSTDAEAHETLLCINTGDKINSPTRMRYTQQEWFKTYDEMQTLFHNHPEVLENTITLANKVEKYELNSDPLMPDFPIPTEFGTLEMWRNKYSETALIEEFTSERYNKLGNYETVLRIKLEGDYLRSLVYKGAIERYGENYNAGIKERIDFELDTIIKMGFPGYFLIIQDVISKGREMGVLIGKGRGSAAGSVVAYCTKITGVDPLAHNLLFERFLNPDRISLPDIDIDFDDDGRSKIIDYVKEKYGKDKVAQICTIGTMKAKGAIKDVCRTLNIELSTVNELTKKINDKGNLDNAYELIISEENQLGSLEKVISKLEKERLALLKDDNEEEAINVETRKIIAEEILTARNNKDNYMEKALSIACTLEGSIRQTGIHACGMLIGRDNLVNNIPLMRAKGDDSAQQDDKTQVTQYEGKFVEPIGLIKMDFLGLNTLSIIKECLYNIKLSKNIDIDLDLIPMDDEKTFEVFRQGATTSIFQFESDGMKQHLKALKPTHFKDLVAMNALYRPGPMEYIPDYIKRKNGKENVVYDHPMMREYLEETYGITVYQEQVMLLSRKLAGFTRGESDNLRKVMGKKLVKQMESLHVKFTDGCKNNIEFMDTCKQINKNPDELINKIWSDWAAFAKYAFNKSHSVSYAQIAYETAYLKAHYPAEFIAANLTCNMSDIKKISILMDECKRMQIKVLTPDVNESYRSFTINNKGNIRFGLAGIKSVGSNAVDNIIEERTANGNFKDIFDFVSRVNLNAVNKKNIEALIYAGAFDSFKEVSRPILFAQTKEDDSFIEVLIKFGNKVKSSSSQELTLFGDINNIVITKPDIPKVEQYNILDFLHKEKEHVGMYLSGHPLDPFKFIIDNTNIIPLKEMENEAKVSKMPNIKIVGFISEVNERMTKTGKPFATITMIDYTSSYTFSIFGKDYTNNKNLLVKSYAVMITACFTESYQRKDDKYKSQTKDNKTDISNSFFTIKNLQLLSEIKESGIKKLSLNINVENINANLVNTLIKIVETNKGQINLYFNILNPNTNEIIKLFSRTHRVSLSDELIEFLENNSDIDKIAIV